MLRLNAQVRQYEGFTPGRRVSGRTPTLLIWAAGSPRFRGFMNPNDSPSTQTREVLAKFRGIQLADLESDLQRGFNLSLISSYREQKTEGFLLWRAVYFFRGNGQSKVDSKWHGPVIIMGRFRNKFASV